jgi:hypothetical protein
VSASQSQLRVEADDVGDELGASEAELAGIGDYHRPEITAVEDDAGEVE